MSARDRERIASFANPPSSSSSASPSSSAAASALGPPPPQPFIVPTVDAPTANSALHGFIPFSDNPLKQARYRSYLLTQSTHTDPTNLLTTLPPHLPSTATLLAELTDFQKAAQIFRPMSAGMANRFTSATTKASGGDTQTTKAGLFVLSEEERERRREEKEKEEREREEEKRGRERGDWIPQEGETPRQEAARMGMYGELTRERREWRPVKLLCKRFGVKDPYPEGGDKTDEGGGMSFAKDGSGVVVNGGRGGEAGAKPIVDPNAWQEKFTHVIPAPPAVRSPASSLPTLDGGVIEGVRVTVSGAAGEEIVLEADEPIEYDRPSMDIFKAIFASDDEDDDDSDEDDASEDEAMPNTSSHKPSTADPLPSSSSTPSSLPQPPQDDNDPDLYLPPPPPPPSALSASLDSSTFRPTFSASSKPSKSRTTPSSSSTSTTSKPKKDKDKKRKKAALVSFGDLEEEEEDGGSVEAKRKEKKVKKGEKERKVEKDDEDEWVEKKVGVRPEEAEGAGKGAAPSDGPSNRKRASAMDFM
jgi:G patch domain-containing protein 1